MKPLALKHTWPLWEQPRYFELGHVLNCAVTEIIPPASVGALNLHHAGCWECDLSDNSLTWSGGVYDIFGLPRDASVSREQAASYYCNDSRTKMESLRAYSIKHRRGFTLDVEISTAANEKRWMRLIAAPICSGDRAIRLRGLKLVI
jgi:hypothetical protein